MQTERLRKDWSSYAGESVTVEKIGGVFYAFGSELGCYRICYKYRYSEPAKTLVDYSQNMKSWFFRLEP